MNFKVGQRVVCVDDRPGLAYGDPLPIKKGVTYTVSYVGKINPGIDLVEAPAPFPLGDPDREYDLYHMRRFRPAASANLTASLAASEVKRQVIERPEHVNEPSPSHA